MATESPMTPESALLLSLARAVARAHRALPGAIAAMVTGSVAKGLADGCSDIDMAVYYDQPLPDDPTLGEVCAALGGTGRRPLGGPRDADACIEAFDLAGVEVQLIHSTVSGWERTMDELLVRHAVGTPLAKALEGISVAVPFYGEAYIERWRARALAFPPELGLVMVKENLRFFPVWGFVGQLETRDATVWYHQILVESCERILGVLSGLNHVYYTPFQFKRMARFVAQLHLAPPELGPRLEALFCLPVAEACLALEALVHETVALVEATLPEVDTSAVRRRVGWRKPGWRVEDVAALLGAPTIH